VPLYPTRSHPPVPEVCEERVGGGYRGADKVEEEANGSSSGRDTST
jgi:hypothetical protein